MDGCRCAAADQKGGCSSCGSDETAAGRGSRSAVSEDRFGVEVSWHRRYCRPRLSWWCPLPYHLPLIATTPVGARSLLSPPSPRQRPSTCPGVPGGGLNCPIPCQTGTVPSGRDTAAMMRSPTIASASPLAGLGRLLHRCTPNASEPRSNGCCPHAGIFCACVAHSRMMPRRVYRRLSSALCGDDGRQLPSAPAQRCLLTSMMRASCGGSGIIVVMETGRCTREDKGRAAVCYPRSPRVG